ncbi:MAG: hypothetical protein ONB48_21715 [candidate division KSB1 bacterium]|nr:hypothetical protein [candidate division KSB1 bacterium]MDZ7276657.1 hypothetical protein [candidate division KSB1 bacterium]MDZ7288267.1 hypothetical protein [candidate division KSB1 bacterium]MDZ7300471.1 hypothetical protein [candidate division KSB1 bacterium]MDZ7306820.1 hypothetical protein [candidate division KSB1 bacterium]
MKSFLPVTAARAFSLAIWCAIMFCSSATQAQVKREHLYKLRDGNRFEGIKTKKWKPVSGTVTLSSLVLGDGQAATTAGEKVAVHFFSTATNDIKLAIFSLAKEYFMEPRNPAFGKDWNVFTWPAKILNEIGLPPDQLDGIATARKGTQDIYFPICFHKPDAASKKLVAKGKLVPDKNMTVTVSLFSADPNKPDKVWENQKLVSDTPFAVELPIAANAKTLLLKVKEHGGREFSYNIHLF